LTEERWELSETVRNGITVGVLGGFTTFSTYMWDVVYHAEGERWVTGGSLLVVTVVLGLGAMLGGLAVGRGA
jgi:CrcB protein